MKTFSELSKKDLTERKSKNFGDEGTRNIVRRFFSNIDKDKNIPDDGGKAGQKRIEDELGLNKRNRRKKIINKINTNKNLNKTYVAPSDKVSRDIQLKSIENQINRSTQGSTTVNNNITPPSNTIKKSKFKNVSRLNKIEKSDPLSKFLFGDDPNKPVKIGDRKIPIKDRNMLNPNTGNVTGTATNTTRISSNTNRTSSNTNRTSSNVNQSQPRIGSRGERLSNPGKTFSQIRNDSQTRIGSGSIKNQIKTDNVVNPNKIKKVIADVDPSTTQRNRVINKKFGDQSLASKIQTKPRVGKLLGRLGAAAAAVDSARVFRNVYKDSQARGDTKRKSALRGASTVAGGIVGGALGTLAAAPIPIPGARLVGGAYGYTKGQELGQKAFDTLSTKTGREMTRRKIGKTFKQFRKNLKDLRFKDALSIDKDNLKKVNQAVGK